MTRNLPTDAHAPDGLLQDPRALHERLDAAQPCLCLIRPDGHLGFRAAPPSAAALGAHLRRIFRSLP